MTFRLTGTHQVDVNHDGIPDQLTRTYADSAHPDRKITLNIDAEGHVRLSYPTQVAEGSRNRRHTVPVETRREAVQILIQELQQRRAALTRAAGRGEIPDARRTEFQRQATTCQQLLDHIESLQRELSGSNPPIHLSHGTEQRIAQLSHDRNFQRVHNRVFGLDHFGAAVPDRGLQALGATNASDRNRARATAHQNIEADLGDANRILDELSRTNPQTDAERRTFRTQLTQAIAHYNNAAAAAETLGNHPSEPTHARAVSQTHDRIVQQANAGIAPRHVRALMASVHPLPATPSTPANPRALVSEIQDHLLHGYRARDAHETRPDRNPEHYFALARQGLAQLRARRDVDANMLHGVEHQFDLEAREGPRMQRLAHLINEANNPHTPRTRATRLFRQAREEYFALQNAARPHEQRVVDAHRYGFGMSYMGRFHNDRQLAQLDLLAPISVSHSSAVADVRRTFTEAADAASEGHPERARTQIQQGRRAYMALGREASQNNRADQQTLAELRSLYARANTYYRAFSLIARAQRERNATRAEALFAQALRLQDRLTGAGDTAGRGRLAQAYADAHNARFPTRPVAPPQPLRTPPPPPAAVAARPTPTREQIFAQRQAPRIQRFEGHLADARRALASTSSNLHQAEQALHAADAEYGRLTRAARGTESLVAAQHSNYLEVRRDFLVARINHALSHSPASSAGRRAAEQWHNGISHDLAALQGYGSTVAAQHADLSRRTEDLYASLTPATPARPATPPPAPNHQHDIALATRDFNTALTTARSSLTTRHPDQAQAALTRADAALERLGRLGEDVQARTAQLTPLRERTLRQYERQFTTALGRVRASDTPSITRAGDLITDHIAPLLNSLGRGDTVEHFSARLAEATGNGTVEGTAVATRDNPPPAPAPAPEAPPAPPPAVPSGPGVIAEGPGAARVAVAPPAQPTNTITVPPNADPAQVVTFVEQHLVYQAEHAQRSGNLDRALAYANAARDVLSHLRWPNPQERGRLTGPLHTRLQQVRSHIPAGTEVAQIQLPQLPASVVRTPAAAPTMVAQAPGGVQTPVGAAPTPPPARPGAEPARVAVAARPAAPAPAAQPTRPGSIDDLLQRVGGGTPPPPLSQRDAELLATVGRIRPTPPPPPTPPVAPAAVAVAAPATPTDAQRPTEPTRPAQPAGAPPSPTPRDGRVAAAATPAPRPQPAPPPVAPPTPPQPDRADGLGDIDTDLAPGEDYSDTGPTLSTRELASLRSSLLQTSLGAEQAIVGIQAPTLQPTLRRALSLSHQAAATLAQAYAHSGSPSRRLLANAERLFRQAETARIQGANRAPASAQGVFESLGRPWMGFLRQAFPNVTSEVRAANPAPQAPAPQPPSPPAPEAPQPVRPQAVAPAPPADPNAQSSGVAASSIQRNTAAVNLGGFGSSSPEPRRDAQGRIDVGGTGAVVGGGGPANVTLRSAGQLPPSLNQNLGANSAATAMGRQISNFNGGALAPLHGEIGRIIHTPGSGLMSARIGIHYEPGTTNRVRIVVLQATVSETVNGRSVTRPAREGDRGVRDLLRQLNTPSTLNLVPTLANPAPSETGEVTEFNVE